MLLCPVIIPEHQKRTVPTIYLKFLDHDFLNQLTKEQRKLFLEYVIIGSEEVYLRYKKAVALALEETNQEFIDLLVKNYAFSFDIDKIIRDISFEKPSLFLCGRQDNCVGYKDIWDIIDEYPRATLSVLDKAGHNLQIEQSQLFTHLVSNWLLKIENDQ